MLLYLVAANPTDSVTDGFLPAAARLGLETVVLTDQPLAHKAVYARVAHPPAEVIGADVHDACELIAALARGRSIGALFSNSDHLQRQTALAAAYYGVPGKDWRSALRAKNKELMREQLAPLDLVQRTVLRPGDELSALADRLPPLPVVIKPRDGVASEDVVLAADPAEAIRHCRQIRLRRPGETLLIEEYLRGQLHTLETISDTTATWILGGFRTTLSPEPYFIEERLDWAPAIPAKAQASLRNQLAALGVGFGACHTEFVLEGERARIIEVNDRIIGDHCDFALCELFGTSLFEQVLRIYCGERLPPLAPSAAGYASTDAVVAERSGTLRAAPVALELRIGTAHLRYRPLRDVGSTVAISHTNRDYLGIVSAFAPTQAAIDSAIDEFRATQHWTIVE